MSGKRVGRLRITVVGVCGSGKSELVGRLHARGLDAHAVAQEHSHVPDLWRHDAEPDLLVYLSATLDSVRRRGKAMTAGELREQHRRLASARRRAQVRVRTDHLTPAEVEATVLPVIERYNASTAQGS